MNIKKCQKRPPVSYPRNPPFGTVFAPHVLRLALSASASNDYQPEILPYEGESFLPSLAALHYGQTIFEGMKAYHQADGSVGVFRADLHASRFRKSAQRMMMADLPEEIFLTCIKEYVAFLADNVPKEEGHSLYLRPLMIAADAKLKVGASHSYLFYIMSTIAGAYFHSGSQVKKARVMVNRQFVRAYPGGLGETKTAANYAASIWAQKIAAQQECDQVLFLDAVHHDYIDELGGMNFFAVRGNELLTPALNGAILHGVTRRSILELAPTLGLKPVELALSFTELKKQIEQGHVTEAFACGTAAVVSPIGEFLFSEKLGAESERIQLPSESVTTIKILDRLSKIQRGVEPGPGPWITKCN
jgi:branched-chain amino acid aminotransferase